MLDVRRKKVKAIYFNAFHCPECGLELHKDNITLTTYPPQYCYYCDCGFRTSSFQVPGFEYEFEEEDLSPIVPEIPEEQQSKIDNLITELTKYISVTNNDGSYKTTNEILNELADAWNNIPLQNVIDIQDSFADSMGYSYV